MPAADGAGHGLASLLEMAPWLGLDRDDLLVYRALLEARAVPDRQVLVASTDLGLARVDVAIGRLTECGFVSSDHPRLPGPALRALMHQRMAEVQAQQAELERSSARIDELVAHLVGSTPEALGGRGVELVTGAREVGERANWLMSSARTELLVLNAPPYAQLSTPEYAEQQDDVAPAPRIDEQARNSAAHSSRRPAVEDVTGQAILRGVRVRHVIAQEGVDVPHRMSELTELVALGLEIRVRPHLPTKLIVADRSTAMLPPTMVADPASSAIVIRDGLLMNLLVPMFDAMWDTALPLGASAAPAPSPDDDPAAEVTEYGPTEEERVLLGLLASGLKDEAIARQLDVHVHTARRRISALLIHLGAATRFQAGLQATRRGWL